VKLKALLLALFVAGCSTSLALADGGGGSHGGKGGDNRGGSVVQRGHDDATSGTTTGEDAHRSAKADDAKPAAKEEADDDADGGAAPACRPSVELEVRGSVAAAPTAATLRVLVTKGSAQGASLVGEQLVFDVGSVRRPAALKQGDGVRVHARACVDLAAGTVDLVASRVDRRSDAAAKPVTTTTTATTTTTTGTTTTGTTAAP
jgi:hypothetical protein